MDAREILQNTSIRLTPVREAILGVLLNERCPMSYGKWQLDSPRGRIV